ncbi:hypothetical protein Glove_606g111 [Diversispora epigaea]|uniref:Uncharacterized protein n=1 Tax=Diversispora epigaea TaxID=1348612 RepID=A0A397G6W4_9GLOM|nr:hypothetical protein Glove_606g111 [Diversispora epigaea]
MSHDDKSEGAQIPHGMCTGFRDVAKVTGDDIKMTPPRDDTSITSIDKHTYFLSTSISRNEKFTFDTFNDWFTLDFC